MALAANSPLPVKSGGWLLLLLGCSVISGGAAFSTLSSPEEGGWGLSLSKEENGFELTGRVERIHSA